MSHYKIKGRLKTKCSFRRPFIYLHNPNLITQPSFSSYWFCLYPD
ncbi:hypothetical protein HMPREF1051_2785 [Neisseria sicca VK64]|uniref:Uncharacterized protein n=1 Tax=Neisseria sicca VK64 TaxID=1095748 RepID=I2NVP5_NEISI|nr:hypothetical protein HMPREF1051_2785 [Neisseria sicca VK64]